MRRTLGQWARDCLDAWLANPSLVFYLPPPTLVFYLPQEDEETPEPEAN